jgi:regulation of enolase protein 1 (concanavalin A-like superfamily)
MAFLLFIGITSQLEATPVNLAWDRNSEVDIAGYVVSYGNQTGTYTTSIDVGNVISSTLDLPAGQRSFVVVQAYNTSSQMSTRSGEIVADLSTTPAPTLTNLSPGSGTVGTSVTISGTNFGSTQGTNIVRFNGTVAPPTSWSASSIVAAVPGGATTGPVTVTVGGVPSNGTTFTVTSPAPSVTSLSPTSGAVGTAVTINGANFGSTQGASTIRFNGTVATPTSWNASSIVAAVPSGATTGPVTVTVNGVASNGATFTVASPAPSVTSLSPTSGAVGTAVTINGANFGATQGTSSLRFNGAVATPTSWNASSIVAAVPSGATTGPVTVTVNGVASNGATFTVTTTPGLPAPWASQDIGNPTIAGQATYTSGTFSVAAAGTDVWDASDQFRFVYQTLDGDGQVVARVATLQNTDPWTKASVMIREDLTANAPHSMTTVAAGNGFFFQSRVTRGGPTTSIDGPAGAAPQWIRVVRTGNALSGSYSVDGTTWTLLGTTTVTMTSRVYVGLALTSHNPSVSASATFSNVAVTGAVTNRAPSLTQPANQTSAEGSAVSMALVASDPDGNPLTYSATGLPASLSVNAATGNVSGTLTFTSAGSYSVTATASDGTLSNGKVFTWTVSDVSQAPSVTSLSPTSGAVGTAVTISGANFGATQGTSTVRFNGMVATPTSWNASSIVAAVPSGATTGPVTVTVNGVASNGASFIVTSPAPSVTSLSPTSGAVGTAVTISGANFGATQGTSTVRFNGMVATPTSWNASSIVAAVPSGATTGSVTVTVNGVASNGASFTVTTTSGLPAPWASQDIGNPTIAGQATYTSGTFSVSAAGIDIWDVSDQFRFVYQTLDGDGQVVARVATLQSTDVWTKAGVMIREDLASNAPHAMAAVTAGNGMILQSRATRGSVSTSIKGFAGVAPRWIRVVRRGNALSGYYSTDGTTWTLMGTTTVTMASRVYVGLALTSHNPSVSTSATFSNVAVTAGVIPAGLSAASMTSTASSAQAATAPAQSTQMSAEKPNAPPTPVNRLAASDYDGDGRSDIAIYRPAAGTWRVVESGAKSARGTTTSWGTATDLPVPGDYDGDGRTDLAYYRASTGTWSILESSANCTTHLDLLLGGGADVPVPGDYDGDSVTDVAVYSPLTGQWWILKSSTDYSAATAIQWSAPQGVPVQGDYDGDGRTDLAMYQPSTGQWLILQSSTDYTTNVTFVLGTSTDVPVPADFDGDGVTDPAVFQRSTGVWRAALSSKGFKATILATLGVATDVPVAADYDGDRRADLAVFRNGTWQILYSQADYASGVSLSWGKRSDVPLPGRR